MGHQRQPDSLWIDSICDDRSDDASIGSHRAIQGESNVSLPSPSARHHSDSATAPTIRTRTSTEVNVEPKSRATIEWDAATRLMSETAHDLRSTADDDPRIDSVGQRRESRAAQSPAKRLFEFSHRPVRLHGPNGHRDGATGTSSIWFAESPAALGFGQRSSVGGRRDPSTLGVAA